MYIDISNLFEQAYIEKVENETFYDLEQKLMEVKDRLSFLVSLKRATSNRTSLAIIYDFRILSYAINKLRQVYEVL